MAFKAGSIYGEATLDTKKWDQGLDRMESGTSGRMKKMGVAIAAGAAVALLAVKALTKIAGELIDAYKEQELAEAALASAIAVTGKASEISAYALKELAGELQTVTLFGDEATISAMALLQNLGDLSQRGIERVTPLIQDMATALNMDLNAAASLVGKTLGSSTNALTRYGVEVDMSGSKSDKLASVIEALESKFGGAAIAAGDTATGAFVKLDNAMGDLKEAGGKVVAEGLKPVADWLIRITTEATTSIVKLQALQGILQGDRGTELEEAEEALKLLLEQREKLSEGKIRAQVSGVQLVKAEIELVDKAIEAQRTHIFSIIRVGIEKKAVADEESKQAAAAEKIAREQAATAQAALDQLEKLKVAYGGTAEGTRAATEAALEYWVAAYRGGLRGIEIDTVIINLRKQLTEETEKAIDVEERHRDLLNSISDEQAEHLKKRREQFAEYLEGYAEDTEDAVEKVKWAWTEEQQHVINVFSATARAASETLGAISNVFSMHYQNQLDTVTQETQAELDTLQSAWDARLVGIEAGSEAEAAINAEFAAKKADIEKDALEKRNEIEKKAFDADKANKIAGVWINAATSIMGWWASMAPLGPAGMVLAGIMTGVTLVMAGVQSALISEQQFVPSKQGGGIASGMTRVNEAGGEIIRLPDQSLVIPHDISRQIAASAGQQGAIINISFAGAQIADSMDLDRVTNTVIRKLGKQMRLAV